MRKHILSLVAAGTLLASMSGVALAAGCPPDANFGCLLTGNAVHGWRVDNASTAASAAGIMGRMTATTPSTSAAAVRGIITSTGSNGYGVWGSHGGGGTGVNGSSVIGTGVVGTHSSTTGGQPGVRGDTFSQSPYAAGIIGQALSSNSGTYGVGVRGVNSGIDGDGYGVWGSHSGSGEGVYGSSQGGSGVHGFTTASGGDGATGVWGEANGQDGYGMVGEARNGVEAYGVVGIAGDGRAVYGENESTVNPAVEGVAFAAGGTATRGEADGANGTGIAGYANNGTQAVGVRGVSTTGWAGYFQGKVRVTGTIQSGTSAMTIDHPLDPRNATLSHMTVESPDMKTVYDGVIKLDANGSAVVNLPTYFQALNQDFRYQLTAIGAPGPQLYVAEKIANNRFRIAGGTSGMEVSWQVTGIRHDPYAQSQSMAVEQPKPASERGSYLYPHAYGQPSAAVESTTTDGREPIGTDR